MKQHIPNALSLIRLGLALTILTLIFFEHNILVAQIVFFVAVVSDKVDGSLARLWNVESELGKKLESLVDPVLASAGGLYVFVHTDLPAWFVIYCGILLAIGMGGRLLIKLKTKKLFYEKSQLTRFGVGAIYILILLYIFQIPYRESVLLVVTAIGTVGGFNYYRMMLRHVQKKSTTSS